MKKVMLIGRTGCGKTTLCQALNDEKIEYKKTQAVEFFDNLIDTPGEYIENRMYYKALLISSMESDIIALLQDCLDEECIFPPGFSSMFSKPVVGIITKMDSCTSNEFIERAENFLNMAGVNKIFKISSTNKFGIDDFKEYLK